VSPAGNASDASGDGVETGKPKSALLLGVDRLWPELNRCTFAAGRFVKQNETNCCTIDAWVARQVFGTVDAAGGTLMVEWGGNRRELTVTGVVEDPFSIRDRLQKFDVLHGARPLEFRIIDGRNIYVPRSVFGASKTIRYCVVRPERGMSPYRAATRIRRALGKRSDRLLVLARGPWIDAICGALDIGFLFSHTIWAIFLALAGAMLMTISLLSISDRAVEIGIRRTQGASRGDVCVQIFLEGLLLSVVGGTAGFLAAPFAGMYLERHMFWDIVIQPGSVLFVAAAGGAVTLLSFLLPAYRASRLEPVEVLRDI
jgi:hypothetical protein